MSIHLILSGGRDKLAVAGIFQPNLTIFPRQVAMVKKRRWSLRSRLNELGRFSIDVRCYFILLLEISNLVDGQVLNF